MTGESASRLAATEGSSGDTTLIPPIDPDAIKCQCAELWSHPAVQVLFGRALRPGGTELSSRMLASAGLNERSIVLDVGCGPGATLELASAAGHRAIGVDLSRTLAAEATEGGGCALVGDAERLPLREAAADAAFVECVVSVLPDKQAAIRELRRVVRPGGFLALTDVTRSAAIPEPLDGALAWVACTGGALSVDGYAALLYEQGFAIESIEDHSGDVLAMVARARRRMALFRGASTIGLVPPLEEFIGPALVEVATATLGTDDLHAGGDRLLSQVSDAAHAGAIGYVALSACAR